MWPPLYPWLIRGRSYAPSTHCFARAACPFRPGVPISPTRRPPSLHYPFTCDSNRPLPFSSFYLFVLPHYCLLRSAYCICSAYVRREVSGPADRRGLNRLGRAAGVIPSCLLPHFFCARSPHPLAPLSSHPGTVAAPQTEPPIARELNEISNRSFVNIVSIRVDSNGAGMVLCVNGWIRCEMGVYDTVRIFRLFYLFSFTVVRRYICTVFSLPAAACFSNNMHGRQVRIFVSRLFSAIYMLTIHLFEIRCIYRCLLFFVGRVTAI